MFLKVFLGCFRSNLVGNWGGINVPRFTHSRAILQEAIRIPRGRPDPREVEMLSRANRAGRVLP